MFRQGLGGVQSCFRGGGGFGPPIFMPNLKAGGTGIDLVSGVTPVCVKSGVTYGIGDDGNTILFAVNQIPLEKDGLRGCPAFTQYFLNNEVPVTQSITLAAGSYCLWVEGSGSATFNGLTATLGDPKVFTLASSFTGNCVITGTVTRAILNSGLFPAPFSPTQGITKSFVSEAGATSFDLDNALLSRLKDVMRGVAVGPNLYKTPTITTPPWTEDSTYYICDGSINSISVYCNNCVQVGKLYEITFTTGAITSGITFVRLGTQLAYSGTPAPFTTYIVRNTTPTTDTSVTISSGTAFIGQIRKDIVVKEVKAQGHLELTFKSNVDSGWMANSTNLSIFTVSDSNATGLFIRKDLGGQVSFRFVDSSFNLSAYVANIIVNTPYRISLDWGIHSTGQKMRITVNGVKSTLANFSGSFGSQDLRFFFGNTVNAGWIVKDSLKVMDRPQW